ncbi:MAG: CpsD/CapB family tyrosine-protein kinase [Ruminococcus sp.]|nr:CpsD/CapB family tyrosine-protein kinase [Ruminococcus sp.]
MAKKRSEHREHVLRFQVTEAYKKARTNLVYSIIKQGCKKIVITSPLKGEGKTTTAVNVAIALSQQKDTKVLVIDCDLRRPMIHTFFKLSGDEKGLVNYLNDECTLEEAISKTKTDSLDLITFGVIPPNPSELLLSDSMAQMVEELEKNYDYIIFDTPPVNMVVDAIPLLGISDGTVLVVKHNSSTYPEFKIAVDTLKRNQANIVGIILNGAPATGVSKGEYFSKNSKVGTYEQTYSKQ